MRAILIVFLFSLIACTFREDSKNFDNRKMEFTENEILEKVDLVFKGIPTDDYPQGNKEDIKYNFFLDLEHGYCVTAGNKIHLYADKNRWAIVFEKCGYQNRGDDAEIELQYGWQLH